ncbi:MAG: nucleotidyl transferase AbiEii/AbiGii toxin family protein [Flavobacteriales bacterium]|nr:nucleotidyl transferase AbiEii/AbiGii toxin family protein [Flavobacteriales bacterium]
MLDLHSIKRYYPAALHTKPQFLLREYLQCRILHLIYTSPLGRELVFLGGTCLRLVHDNSRFSEDLDFDNRGLSSEAFDEVAEVVRTGLERMGYTVHVDVVKKGAYHCYVKLPGLLFQEGLSGHVEAKILISLDAEPQHYRYEPEVALLDRFDTFTNLLSTPLPLLLAQKCLAILERKRSKGRDFFDVAFLLSRGVTAPDMDYLKERRGLDDTRALCEALLERCASLDMEQMARDVDPFLFEENGRARVIHFPQLIRQHWLRN